MADDTSNNNNDDNNRHDDDIIIIDDEVISIDSEFELVKQVVIIDDDVELVKQVVTIVDDDDDNDSEKKMPPRKKKRVPSSPSSKSPSSFKTQDVIELLDDDDGFLTNVNGPATAAVQIPDRATSQQPSSSDKVASQQLPSPLSPVVSTLLTHDKKNGNNSSQAAEHNNLNQRDIYNNRIHVGNGSTQQADESSLLNTAQKDAHVKEAPTHLLDSTLVSSSSSPSHLHDNGDINGSDQVVDDEPAGATKNSDKERLEPIGDLAFSPPMTTNAGNTFHSNTTCTRNNTNVCNSSSQRADESFPLNMAERGTQLLASKSPSSPNHLHDNGDNNDNVVDVQKMATAMPTTIPVAVTSNNDASVESKQQQQRWFTLPPVNTPEEDHQLQQAICNSLANPGPTVSPPECINLLSSEDEDDKDNEKPAPSPRSTANKIVGRSNTSQRAPAKLDEGNDIDKEEDQSEQRVTQFATDPPRNKRSLDKGVVIKPRNLDKLLVAKGDGKEQISIAHKNSLHPSGHEPQAWKADEMNATQTQSTFVSPNKGSCQQVLANKALFWFPCACKKTKCLRKFCSCFAAERNCQGCNCATGCRNTKLAGRVWEKPTTKDKKVQGYNMKPTTPTGIDDHANISKRQAIAEGSLSGEKTSLQCETSPSFPSSSSPSSWVAEGCVDEDEKSSGSLTRSLDGNCHSSKKMKHHLRQKQNGPPREIVIKNIDDDHQENTVSSKKDGTIVSEDSQVHSHSAPFNEDSWFKTEDEENGNEDAGNQDAISDDGRSCQKTITPMTGQELPMSHSSRKSSLLPTDNRESLPDYKKSSKSAQLVGNQLVDNNDVYLSAKMVAVSEAVGDGSRKKPSMSPIQSKSQLKAPPPLADISSCREEVLRTLQRIQQQRSQEQNKLLRLAIMSRSAKQTASQRSRLPRRNLRLPSVKKKTVKEERYVVMISSNLVTTECPEVDEREEEMVYEALDANVLPFEYKQMLLDMEKVLVELKPDQRYHPQVHGILKSEIKIEVPIQFRKAPSNYLLSSSTPQRLQERGAKEGSSDDYKSVMESFRDYFCIQCKTFDCRFHILNQEKDPATQASAAIAFENKRKKQKQLEVTMTIAPTAVNTHVNCPLTAQQELIASRLELIFQGNKGRLSAAMGGRDPTTLENLQPTPWKSPDPKLFKPIHPSKKKFLPNNVKERIKAQGPDRNFFFPCCHPGPCRENDCTCIDHNTLCTKHCILGDYSPNFFHGCNCKSKCRTHLCQCFLANRECDPDICNCCEGDCHGCQNMDVTLKRRKPLLLGESTIPGAGWGLFTKKALKKGDYIDEYVGEFLNMNLVDRQFNETGYLFDISKDYVADAQIQGNKTRYINHSDEPNLDAKVCYVNGEPRIAFFADMNIPAQSELFYHYGEHYAYKWKKK